MDTKIMKLVGKIDPTLAAKIAPENDASTAPTTNAHSLVDTVSTPIASATLSSSRMAIHARPSRERSSRHETYTATAQNASTSRNTERGSEPFTSTTPKSAGGMLVMPCAPPNQPLSQSDRNSRRMISPKPSVTMAR